MIARTGWGDYVFLIESAEEFEKLAGSPLVGKLERYDREACDKIAKLGLGDARNCDGIDLSFFPEGSSFGRLIRVEAVVSRRVYELMRSQREVAACYDGSNKIRIKRMF